MIRTIVMWTRIMQANDEMDMIRHDDERIQGYTGVMIGQIIPTLTYDPTVLIFMHDAIDNLAQGQGVIADVGCDEIVSG